MQNIVHHPEKPAATRTDLVTIFVLLEPKAAKTLWSSKH